MKVDAVLIYLVREVNKVEGEKTDNHLLFSGRSVRRIEFFLYLWSESS